MRAMYHIRRKWTKKGTGGQAMIGRFVVLFLCLVFQTEGANANSKYDRQWKKIKESCEKVYCTHFDFPEEAYNCVNE